MDENGETGAGVDLPRSMHSVELVHAADRMRGVISWGKNT